MLSITPLTNRMIPVAYIKLIVDTIINHHNHNQLLFILTV
jgi:hypothetical protein